jgi:glutathione reductase (NADPH)
VRNLIQATLYRGIQIYLGYEATKIEAKDGMLVTNAIRSDGSIIECQSGLVINAAGRVPNTSDLELGNAGIVKGEQSQIVVDAKLRVEDKSNIYALGDVIGKRPFTEAVNYEADILLHNINNPKDQIETNYHGLPMVIYTYPKMAVVGKNSKQLLDNDIKHKSKKSNLSEFFTERIHANQFAESSTCINEKTKKILGVSLLGTSADDMINYFALAMQYDIGYDQLQNIKLAYPTATHDTKFLF